MRITFLGTLIIAFAIASCTKTAIEKTANRSISEGMYKGTFQRLGTNKGEADVTITFDKETFTGENRFPKYPAICKGRYSINGDTATFETFVHGPQILTGVIFLEVSIRFRSAGILLL